MKLACCLAALLASMVLATAGAGEVTVEMGKISSSGKGEIIGTITVTETAYGLLFTPKLNGLPPGVHGFHIHEHADCSPAPDAASGEIIAGGGAGGHYDPHKTGKHGSPWTDGGHLGDLPPLYAGPDGAATTPVLAPRIKSITEIINRSLMIHEGGDNFSDTPKPNGGGAGRIACGSIR